jgi:hypothetical protein
VPIVVAVIVDVPLFVLAMTEQLDANVQTVFAETSAGGFVTSTAITSPLDVPAIPVANVVAAFAQVSYGLVLLPVLLTNLFATLQPDQ